MSSEQVHRDLFSAALYGKHAHEDPHEEVERLLDEGANPNWANPQVHEMTALHSAAQNGHPEIVRTLLARGAELEKRDYLGKTALHRAVNRDHKSTVRVLIEAGANVHAEDKDGITPLTKALTLDRVGLLLHAGANIEPKEYKDGENTVLHLAVRWNRESAVRELIKAGAYVHAKNKVERTPLHYSKSKAVVEALVGAGADFARTDQDGWTPLHCACHMSDVQKETVTALATAGVDVHARSKTGNTALHCAAKQSENLFRIDELVAAGASLDCTNDDGQTPRDIATPGARLALDRARLTSQFEVQVPPDRVMLMFCGNGLVGKTTLTKALEHGRADPAHPVVGRTYGFDSFGAVVPHAGKCTMVDFGGQPEFWVPHGHFLGNRSGVYLVVVNLGDPPSTQRSQLRHWLRFIVSRSEGDTRPQVAVVGSHRGAAQAIKAQLKEESDLMLPEEKEELILRLKQLESITNRGQQRVCSTLQDTTQRFHAEFLEKLDVASNPFLIESVDPDDMDSAELARLYQWLCTAFGHIRDTRKVPQVCLRVAELVVTHLRPKLPPISTYGAVMTALKEAAGDSIDFSDDARNRAIMSHLWEAGHLMVFEEVADTVVVNPQAFGTHVIGQLFCPHGDPDFTSLVVNKDDCFVFRTTQLEAHLAEVRERGCDFGDAALALELLTALELIIPLPTTPDTVNDPVFAIPGRLNQGDAVLEEYRRRPTECWSEPRQFDGWVYLGVRLKLTSPLSLIPPSEFPRLQHRLSKMTGFRMWRHGLCVRRCTPRGLIEVEGLIELDLTLEHIDVCVRSEVGAEEACTTELIELVEACQRVSPHFECGMFVTESLKKHADSERAVADGVGADTAERSNIDPVTWLRQTLKGPAYAQREAEMDRLALNGDAEIGIEPLNTDVLISYSTKVDPDCADDERGKQLTIHITSLLATHNTSCYHGLMVPPGEVWWHHWFGRVAGCKVAIVVLSPAYFASEQCIRELNALLEHKKELRIIPVVAAAGVAEAMQGDFLGTTERGRLQAAGIRALFRTNWLPPPDESGGIFKVDCAQSATLLVETVQAKLRELQP